MHRAVAKELLEAGFSKEPLPLDADFLLRYQEYQKMFQDKKKAAPAAVEEPAAGEKPASAEEPAAVEQPPAAVEGPAAVEEPAAVEKPPAAAEEPAAVKPKKGELQSLHKQCLETKDLDFFELCLETLRVEDLGAEQQAYYRKVEATGLGVCSRCRWKYGCLSCDNVKAWAYFVRWSLGYRSSNVVELEAEDVGKAKPKGGGTLSEVVVGSCKDFKVLGVLLVFYYCVPWFPVVFL